MDTASTLQTEPVALDTLRRESNKLAEAISAGASWLFEHQHDDGFWAAPLESNACMEAEWLLCFFMLGYKHPHHDELIESIRARQRSDGSWETYRDAPSGDINATVEAYAALRVTGASADEPHLVRAREWILARGGLTKIRVFTRYWLAMIGEWPWERTPALPPEILFLPRWFPFSIYNFASWARATLVPLCVLSARRFVRPLPSQARLDELFPQGREKQDYTLPKPAPMFSWERLFLAIDRGLHVYTRGPVQPGREAALAACLEWIVRHQDADGSWGGIQPPWIYSLLALHSADYANSHPVMRRGLDGLNEHWKVQIDGHVHIQASDSIIWDTVLSLFALHECDFDLAANPATRKAVSYLLDKENRYYGDWKHRTPRAKPGGWAFERDNLHYPDIDDTAVAILALLPVADEVPQVRPALERARDWMLAMQSRNGGWGAFDRDNDSVLLTRIPFADFGEALDPPSVDVTAHVLEALAGMGMDASDPSVAAALAFVWREQESDGSWFGRWGVNHVYGTGAVLPALRALDIDMADPRVARALDWLCAVQNADGGWGESCGSYMDAELRGQGASTASQTGWALLGLLAGARPQDQEAIRRGVRFLVDSQDADGTWEETLYTGTGFPGYGVGARVTVEKKLQERLQQGTELSRAFMIRYHMYRHYFPLMALGRARKLFPRLLG